MYERGDVYWARLPAIGVKPVLIVSARVVSVVLRPIVARITSIERERSIPTVVPLTEGEIPELPVSSWILCHDLFTLLDTSSLKRIGTISPSRMVDVEEALSAALAL